MPEIPLIVLCGTMAGAEDFCEIERWARQKLDFLRRLLPFEKGVASHHALNDLMNALPTSLFAECFTNCHGADGSLLQLVSAWASRQRLVLGQEAVDEKSSEIVAIALLLERLDLKGALVTIDATRRQREIAEKIRAKGADYLLASKDNWPALAEDARLCFEREREACDARETTDGDHGRIEVRRHYVSHAVDWLSTDRRLPGEPRFPALAMSGMIEATVERVGKTSVARRYSLSSALLSAEQLAHAAWAHWVVENGLHWVLDVVFHDDLMRLRAESGPADMATIKHAALDLIKDIPDEASLKIKKKTAAWNDDYLSRAITRP